MKLYYSPGACSLADHIVLEWIGKPYEAIRVSRDDRKSPEFLRLNPAGAVPVLQDGDWVLTQNMAILNFLADSFPEAWLGGDGTPRRRAEVNRWLAFVSSDVHTAFKPMFVRTASLEPDTFIEKRMDAARQSLRSVFRRAAAAQPTNTRIARC